MKTDSTAGRPECFEFAMNFLGGDDAEHVRAYVEKLEAALMAIADGTVPTYLAAMEAFELERTDDLKACIRALREFAREAIT